MSPKEMREQKDTKEKIIEVAARLFARHGFSGTSVREIAKQAKVNLSAINYHFDNKDNLYLQVFAHNHDWLASNIEALAEEDSLSLEELTAKVFHFFIENGPAMMNTFKIFLSDEVTIPSEMMCQEEEEMGPPGHKAFMRKITQTVGESVPLEARDWAVRMIFSNIVHLGLCSCTPTMKEKCKTQPHLTPEHIKKALCMHTRAIISFIENRPQDFLNQ
jgi:AcrR family transcriptional regulator